MKYKKIDMKRITMYKAIKYTKSHTTKYNCQYSMDGKQKQQMSEFQT